MKKCKPYFKKIKSFAVTTIFDLEFQKFTSKCRIACSIEWRGQEKCKYLNCRENCHLAYIGEHTVYKIFLSWKILTVAAYQTGTKMRCWGPHCLIFIPILCKKRSSKQGKSAQKNLQKRSFVPASCWLDWLAKERVTAHERTTK